MGRHTFLEPAKIMLKPPPGSGRVSICEADTEAEKEGNISILRLW